MKKTIIFIIIILISLSSLSTVYAQEKGGLSNLLAGTGKIAGKTIGWAINPVGKFLNLFSNKEKTPKLTKNSITDAISKGEEVGEDTLKDIQKNLLKDLPKIKDIIIKENNGLTPQKIEEIFNKKINSVNNFNPSDFTCDTSYCEGDFAPGKNNPCSQNKTLCATACCNEAYDGSLDMKGACKTTPKIKSNNVLEKNPIDSQESCTQITKNIFKKEKKKVQEECKKALDRYNFYKDKKITNELYKDIVKKCQIPCQKINMECREREISCQEQAKEKVKDILGENEKPGLLVRNQDIISKIPTQEASSCYDKENGLNRHEMTAQQYKGLTQIQKIDFINNKHPIIGGNKEFVLGYKILDPSFVPYEDTKLIMGRPVDDFNILADRIKNAPKITDLKKSFMNYPRNQLLYSNYKIQEAMAQKGLELTNENDKKYFAKILGDNKDLSGIYFKDYMAKNAKDEEVIKPLIAKLDRRQINDINERISENILKRKIGETRSTKIEEIKPATIDDLEKLPGFGKEYIKIDKIEDMPKNAKTLEYLSNTYVEVVNYNDGYVYYPGTTPNSRNRVKVIK